MDKNDLFKTIQKHVFEYCDKIKRTELILLIDAFVFDPTWDILDKEYVKNFVTELSCLDSYERYLDDLNNNPYVLKCGGSELKYIEDLKISLLVKSYNLLRQDEVKKLKRRRKK
jgi:hypothetical protein